MLTSAAARANVKEITIHVLYRFYTGENTHQRPSYYSKSLCLESMVVAVNNCPGAELTIIQDGKERHPALEALPQTVTVERGHRAGNSGSFLRALEVAVSLTLGPQDLIYLVEDDYLHTPDSLLRLSDGARGIPNADYFTLYEHPNSYAFDVPDGKEFVYLVNGSYWRTITSTCMTFAGRASAFARDKKIMVEKSQGPNPDDYAMWLALQSRPMVRRLLALLLRLRRGRQRVLDLSKATVIRARRSDSVLLVCCLPSAATHLDLSAGLAPAQDWAVIAASIRSCELS